MEVLVLPCFQAAIVKLQAVLQIQFKFTIKHDMHTTIECF